MSVHPIDYEFQANVFITPELRALFDEKAKLGRWLRFEAALAEAQGELGVIPKEAASEIAKNAHPDCLDMESVREGYQTSRNSIIPVLKALKQACRDGHGEFVHYGATTQDAIDSGEILELKETLDIVYRDLRDIEGKLIKLTREHGATPMIGRSHGQHALPITLGLKITIWLGEIRRHIVRVKSLAGRALVGQLGGAVGTMAALGKNAEQVKRLTFEKLGLSYSATAWHTSRDNVAEICAFLTMVTNSAAKIANEVFLLARTEFGEMFEPPPGRNVMSSSTMPHKRNPALCERVVVLSRHVRGLLGIVMESSIHENERDARALWSEWLAVPQIAIYSATALDYVRQIIGGLEVYPERMLSNLHLQRDFVASEWLLFRLGARMGKSRAQELLHQTIQQAVKEKKPLSVLLKAHEELGPLLDAEDIKMTEEPERYIGHTAKIIDSVLSEVEALHLHDEATLRG